MLNFKGVYCKRKAAAFHLSSDQNSRWLRLYIGDDILPSYIGIKINHYKHPAINQPVFHGMLFQGFVALADFFVKCHRVCVVRHVWDFYPEERSELLRTVERHADAWLNNSNLQQL